MKLSIFFAFFFATITFSNGCKKNNSEGWCNPYPIPADTYRYPIVPGVPAWANLQTGDERLAACQIPDSILSNISTEGLVQSWLDMPINNEITMANSPQKAMIFFMEKFSGLRELVKRTDAADIFFKRYQFFNPACVTNYQGIEEGKFVLSSIYIDLPLAQDTILKKMTLQLKKALMKEALDKYKVRKKYADHYDVFTTDLSLFICAKAMVNSNYPPFLNKINNNLQWFINNALFPAPLGEYANERDIIMTYSSNFIK